ncbi:glycine--tRNA ligase subunit beta [Niallia taxi]|uniref:glycine--tRNA ligase subunit beta n=1 Tax=Niallia taxi TaxID=2499688 RepID=UPI0015F72441|nr:glycine--tRNA ligase subunit beta [Niallia taxi]MCM3215342.1 glycine--tRNA ligase subunit beta [Niallia taxi]MED4038017.1 glycine--tRNA ligase subunit beta [Niallia taxi]MED4055576.1 glycine--tRNA ligase subunit beta [Niallia taxi]MED4117767.1 glycine--tRNA ligase subunit beta [Niallia taxi]
MSKKDLLLEIGLEEMPARFVTSSMNSLKEKVEAWLNEKQLQFDAIEAFSTPRRLAILVSQADEAQKDIEEEAKGPAKKIALDEKGEWSKAAAGFTRGQGATVEDIYFKEINGVEYAHVKKFIKGQATIDLLPALKDIILSLTFPKNMRWANNDLRYIRPIKWIVALFGDTVVPFSITGVETDRKSLGHRFLGGEISFTQPSNYKEALLSQFVIANPEERKEAILSQIKKIAEENDWIIPIDADLLEEVNNLVEYPTALFGKFEEAFLELPTEVLITSMKEHQRYFPVKSKDNTLLPYFITVRNGDHNHLEKVAKGNEKVLRARLADAAFFYKEDQKQDIDKLLAKLQSIVYHEEIGTLSEKVARVQGLTNNIADTLNFSADEKKNADRAAQISKFDLVTNMVYEFPELQGLMGEKYALQKGEAPAVAKAINEHYMPRHADDNTASSNEGAALALAEKLDTIVSFFAIGLIPTGSQDPYALRRQATGVVQTLMDKEWDLSLEELVSLAMHNVKGFAKTSEEELHKNIIDFFKARIKHILQAEGIRYDLIDAVLGDTLGSPASLLKKAKVLDSHKDDANFKNGIEALARVINISKKAEVKGSVNSSLFENDEEGSLFQAVQSVKEKLTKDTEEDVYFTLLLSLESSIASYFDNTMVMSDNPSLKENRLNQMTELADIIKGFANVSEIMVK